jgi:hypothetical protein
MSFGGIGGIGLPTYIPRIGNFNCNYCTPPQSPDNTKKVVTIAGENTYY